MQDWDESRRVDFAFTHQQRAQLRIPVLLDDKYVIMFSDEIVNLVAEGAGNPDVSGSINRQAMR